MGVCPIFGILTCVHGEHVWAPSTSAQNCAHPSWWGQSKRPHSNLGRCKYVLLWYRVSYGNLISEQSISWRIELSNQIGYSGRNSHADASNLCLQFTWRYGNLPLQHTSAHGGHFWPSPLVAMGAYQTVQGREFVIPLMLRTKRRTSRPTFNSGQFDHRLGVVSRKYVILLHIICVALWKSASTLSSQSHRPYRPYIS